MILTVIGCISLAWVLTQWMEIIAEETENYALSKYICWKCYAFWVGLSWGIAEHGYKGILIASISSLIAYLIDKTLIKKGL